ncbi:MAG TPA: hypothetical protein VH062_30140 [Polyangiaceae bacterium]|nr:hypothetical protein [Polyangiaceae bacterium]
MRAPLHPRRAMLLVVLACTVALATGCNQRAIESWLSQSEGADGGSLYNEAAFSRAMAELKKHAPSPVEALSLLVYPDHAVLQARDPAAPKTVVQYVYRGGTVAPPVLVKLLGTGKLDDNLFPLESVKLAALPKLAKDAKAKANIPEGVVARVLVKRNLPDASDVQFRVFVTSQRRDATLDADDTGRLIE